MGDLSVVVLSDDWKELGNLNGGRGRENMDIINPFFLASGVSTRYKSSDHYHQIRHTANKKVIRQ